MGTPMLRYWSTGVVQYKKAYRMQKILSSKIQESGQNVVLLVEHPPVYTIGIRTNQYSTEEEEKLKLLGADFHRTNRGGLITFHGPGQLVAYPIVNLKNYGLGIRTYVCKLEKAVMQTCKYVKIIFLSKYFCILLIYIQKIKKKKYKALKFCCKKINVFHNLL